jgi:hypothetical protein
MRRVSSCPSNKEGEFTSYATIGLTVQESHLQLFQPTGVMVGTPIPVSTSMGLCFDQVWYRCKSLWTVHFDVLVGLN